MKYILNEEQYTNLISRKKNKKLVEGIIKLIDKENVTSKIFIEEAVNDKLNILRKKNNINEDVKKSLIDSGKLNKSQISLIK